MPQVVKVKSICKYNGHSIKNNKSVDLSLVFNYEELPNYVKLLQFLNENVEITARIREEAAMNIGTYMIRDFRVDHDGQGIIKFNSMLDHIEADEITKLVGETFKIIFKANIEVDGGESDGD